MGQLPEVQLIQLGQLAQRASEEGYSKLASLVQHPRSSHAPPASSLHAHLLSTRERLSRLSIVAHWLASDGSDAPSIARELLSQRMLCSRSVDAAARATHAVAEAQATRQAPLADVEAATDVLGRGTYSYLPSALANELAPLHADGLRRLHIGEIQERMNAAILDKLLKSARSAQQQVGSVTKGYAEVFCTGYYSVRLSLSPSSSLECWFVQSASLLVAEQHRFTHTAYRCVSLTHAQERALITRLDGLLWYYKDNKPLVHLHECMCEVAATVALERLTSQAFSLMFNRWNGAISVLPLDGSPSPPGAKVRYLAYGGKYSAQMTLQLSENEPRRAVLKHSPPLQQQPRKASRDRPLHGADPTPVNMDVDDNERKDRKSDPQQSINQSSDREEKKPLQNGDVPQRADQNHIHGEKLRDEKENDEFHHDNEEEIEELGPASFTALSFEYLLSDATKRRSLAVLHSVAHCFNDGKFSGNDDRKVMHVDDVNARIRIHLPAERSVDMEVDAATEKCVLVGVREFVPSTDDVNTLQDLASQCGHLQNNIVQELLAKLRSFALLDAINSAGTLEGLHHASCGASLDSAMIPRWLSVPANAVLCVPRSCGELCFVATCSDNGDSCQLRAAIGLKLAAEEIPLQEISTVASSHVQSYIHDIVQRFDCLSGLLAFEAELFHQGIPFKRVALSGMPVLSFPLASPTASRRASVLVELNPSERKSVAYAICADQQGFHWPQCEYYGCSCSVSEGGSELNVRFAAHVTPPTLLSAVQSCLA